MKTIKRFTCVLLLGLLMVCSMPVFAASNTLHSIDIRITIANDGSAVICETWDMTIGEGTEVYKEMKNMDGSAVHSLIVTENDVAFETLPSWNVDASREEKAQKAGIVTRGNGYELCFGVGEYGQHTYTMQYTVDNFVQQYEDIYGMNYQLVNADMSMKPSRVSVIIESPLFTEETKVWAFGFEGSIYLEQDAEGYYISAHNELEDGSLGRVRYVNILSGFTGATFTGANPKHQNRAFADVIAEATEDSDYKSPSFFVKLLSILQSIPPAMYLVLLVGAFRLFSHGKTKKSSVVRTDMPKLRERDTAYFREIPCRKDIFLFYHIATNAKVVDLKTAQSGILAGILMRWIRDGNVTFVKTEKRKLFSTKDTFIIHFNYAPESAHPLEKTLYRYFQAASGENEILEDKEFEKWCQENYSTIENWFDSIDSKISSQLEPLGYLDRVPVTKKTLFGTREITELQYNATFTEELSHVVGFKKFLKEFGNLDEKEITDVVLWEDYLIFASVLGMADEVEAQIGTLYPDFAQHSQLDIEYTTLATRAFLYRGVTQMHRARTAAEIAEARASGDGGSSSFSGGGSSFSGGGGGGVR